MLKQMPIFAPIHPALPVAGNAGAGDTESKDQYNCDSKPCHGPAIGFFAERSKGEGAFNRAGLNAFKAGGAFRIYDDGFAVNGQVVRTGFCAAAAVYAGVRAAANM